MTVDSSNQFDPLCVPIPIINDNVPEPEECFTIFFFDMDNDPLFDVIEPDQAMVCITDDDSGATRKYETCRIEYISTSYRVFFFSFFDWQL